MKTLTKIYKIAENYHLFTSSLVNLWLKWESIHLTRTHYTLTVPPTHSANWLSFVTLKMDSQTPEILSNFSLKMSDFLIQISEPSDPILVFNLIFMLLMTPNLSFNHFLGKNLAPFLRLPLSAGGDFSRLFLYYIVDLIDIVSKKKLKKSRKV